MGAQLGGGGGKREGMVGINVTPMVDVVLVLLVIMMVSATYIVSRSLNVELPKSASSDDNVTSIAAVSVSKDGKFNYNQEPVTPEGLVLKFREAKAQNPDVNLVISADTHAEHGNVIKVIDLAKQEGILKFALNVDQP
jgi:biopolymer transport protein ExbD